MNPTFDHLERFFQSFISLGFLQRIFGWKSVRTLSYHAFEEFRNLANLLRESVSQRDSVTRDLESLQKETDRAKGAQEKLEQELRSTITKQLFEINQLREKSERIAQECASLNKELIALKQAEVVRREGHEKEVATLGAIQRRILDDRKAEQDEQQRLALERQRRTKEKWSRHEEDVRTALRNICQKHTIEYVQQIPFRGNPDNVVRICGEYVVFDAKSPGGEDLRNFPQYIRSQTEAVRKYADQENVRKEIFLVVPTSTVDVIPQFCYNLADYVVYVVTPDALEPIVLSLKKLEDYEFVNQLSPEDRENICRLIGKFAHIAKRRIQVDHFFAWEFLDVLTRCEAGLPREMMQRIVEFEKSEKLNPPQERRSKQILTSELESDTKRLQREAEAREVVLPPSVQESLNLPLFEKKND